MLSEGATLVAEDTRKQKRFALEGASNALGLSGLLDGVANGNVGGRCQAQTKFRSRCPSRGGGFAV